MTPIGIILIGALLAMLALAVQGLVRAVVSDAAAFRGFTEGERYDAGRPGPHRVVCEPESELDIGTLDLPPKSRRRVKIVCEPPDEIGSLECDDDWSELTEAGKRALCERLTRDGSD